MAIIVANTPDGIEFRDAQTIKEKNAAFVSAQLGEWECNSRVDTGIVVDSSGLDVPPVVMSANNARKLSKWLARAADQLDAINGVKPAKKRQYYEQDDDNEYPL